LINETNYNILVFWTAKKELHVLRIEDNQAAVTNSTIAHSSLNKRHIFILLQWQGNDCSKELGILLDLWKEILLDC
jgi:hypothetical protein